MSYYSNAGGSGQPRQKKEKTNEVTLVGTVNSRGRDGVIRYIPFNRTAGGVIHINMAVEQPMQAPGPDGMPRTVTTYIPVDVVTNQKIDASMLSAVRPGMRARVVGELKNDSYTDRNGQSRTALIVRAFVFEILAQQPDGQYQTPQTPAYGQPAAYSQPQAGQWGQPAQGQYQQPYGMPPAAPQGNGWQPPYPAQGQAGTWGQPAQTAQGYPQGAQPAYGQQQGAWQPPVAPYAVQQPTAPAQPQQPALGQQALDAQGYYQPAAPQNTQQPAPAGAKGPEGGLPIGDI